MPNIENLEKVNHKEYTNKYHKPFLQVQREEIIYRDDVKTTFGYALTGILITLAAAGIVYTVGRKLIA